MCIFNFFCLVHKILNKAENVALYKKNPPGFNQMAPRTVYYLAVFFLLFYI